MLVVKYATLEWVDWFIWSKTLTDLPDQQPARLEGDLFTRRTICEKGRNRRR